MKYFLSLAVISAFSISFAQPAPALTDAEIGKIVKQVNDNEIDAGKLAMKQTKNVEIKRYASHMLRAHGSMNDDLKKTFEGEKISMKSSANDLKLKDDGKKEAADLVTKKDSAFDKTYIDNAVNDHAAVLKMLDDTLIPSAKNAKVKALLMKARPDVAGHLKMAQDEQAKMSK